MGAPGFSRGTATPTRDFDDVMAHDPSAGYADLRPIVVGGLYSGATSTPATTTTTPATTTPARPTARQAHARPQTFAGGMLPETFLRLTEPVPPASTGMASVAGGVGLGMAQPQLMPYQAPGYTGLVFCACLLCNPTKETLLSILIQHISCTIGGRPETSIAGHVIMHVAQARLAKNYGLSRMDPFVRFQLGRFERHTTVSDNGTVRSLGRLFCLFVTC